MTSPKSSAGSKSVTGFKENIQLRNYLNDDCNREALQSSWIRRLHLKPTSPSSPSPTPPSPITITRENPHPRTPLTAANSPSTAGSGSGSRAPASMFGANTALFLHRLLKLRKEKPPLRVDPESFSVSGFGPFQVQTRRVSSTDGHLRDNDLEVKDGNGGDLGFTRQDSVAGMDGGWNFNYSKNLNSSSDACFPTLQTLTRFVVEQEKEEQQQQHQMEDNSSLQQNWFPTNHRTLFTGETMFSSESNYINNDNNGTRKSGEMVYFPERRMSDDQEQHNNTLSPFFGYWSALKEHDSTNPVTTLRKNGCLFGPSEDNTKLDSCNLNHPWPVGLVGGENRCSPSSRSLVAGDRRMSVRHLPVSPWPMSRASHEISYFSRTGGVTYHESCDDSVAGRTYRDTRPTCHNAATHQYERHAPACPSETESDPSSFWNMNSFQRAEMVSSIFQACRTGSNRKRNFNADEFVSMKSRKLGPEG